MEYQEHLLKNVFNGDKARFEKAWQEALDEGCEGAISWSKLSEPVKMVEVVEKFDVHALTRFEGLPNTLASYSCAPLVSYFIWKT